MMTSLPPYWLVTGQWSEGYELGLAKVCSVGMGGGHKGETKLFLNAFQVKYEN